MFLFRSRIHPGHHIVFHHRVSLGFSSLRSSPGHSCFWWAGPLEEHWSGPLAFSGISLMVLLGAPVHERMTREVKCHSPHVISRARTNITESHCWCWPGSLSEGVCQAAPLCSLFPLSVLCSVQETTTYAPHLRSEETGSIFLTVGHLHKYSEFVCVGDWSLPCVYAVLYLHKHGFIHFYFIPWRYNPILLHFV